MNSFFSDIAKTRQIHAELNYRGSKKDVWFRPLTAAERAELSRGQKIRLKTEDGPQTPDQRTVEVDAHDIIMRTHKFLAFCCVDERGKQVFKNANDVGQLPEDLVSALNVLANEKLGDEDPGDLGNSSTETQN